MNFYFNNIRLYICRELTFRWIFIWRIVGNILFLLLYKGLWKSIFAGSEVLKGFTINQLMTYYILARIITLFTSTRIDRDISRTILSGNFSTLLLKPVNPLLTLATSKLATSLTRLLIFCIPIAVVSKFFFKMITPFNIISFIGFVLSLLLAFILKLNIDILAGQIAFWVRGTEAVTHLKDFVFWLFSGSLIPLAFFPNTLHIITNYLPFRMIIDLPARIYIYGLENKQIIQLGIACFWCIVLVLLNKLVYKNGIKNMIVYGG